MRAIIDQESPSTSNVVMPQEVDKSQAMLDIDTEPRAQKQERYANYDYNTSNSMANLMVDRVASPDDEVEFSMFETPSSQMVEENRVKFSENQLS